MGRNIYTEQGTEVTWTVPVPCPHNEVAYDAHTSWCETCGAVLSGGMTVMVHPSDHTVCSLIVQGETCGHGEEVVRRDARDWIGAAVR